MSIENYLDKHPKVNGSLKVTLSIFGFGGGLATLAGCGIIGTMLRTNGMSTIPVAKMQIQKAQENWEEGWDLLNSV